MAVKRGNRMKRLLMVATAAVGALLAGSVLLAAPGPAKTARAELSGAEGSAVRGSVTFRAAGGRVQVHAEVENVPAGVHGFHLHEKGDCSAADFTSAGGHFNPAGVAHGAPDAEPHHAGDFGNITVGEDGKGSLELESNELTLDDGPTGVVGRAIILHAGEDDLHSQPTGNAGARLACGVVKLAERDM